MHTDQSYSTIVEQCYLHRELEYRFRLVWFNCHLQPGSLLHVVMKRGKGTLLCLEPAGLTLFLSWDSNLLAMLGLVCLQVLLLHMSAHLGKPVNHTTVVSPRHCIHLATMHEQMTRDRHPRPGLSPLAPGVKHVPQPIASLKTLMVYTDRRIK